MSVPRVRDANDVIDIGERALKELVCQNGTGVGEPIQRVICEARLDAHDPRM